MLEGVTLKRLVYTTYKSAVMKGNLSVNVESLYILQVILTNVLVFTCFAIEGLPKYISPM